MIRDRQARAERPVADVPAPVVTVLLLALAAQIAWHAGRPSPAATAEGLSRPPAAAALRLLSLGEPATLSRLLMLWLQAFDHQPGISIPFRQLDYDRVRDWLAAILELDPRSRYPLLSAARIYTQVPDAARVRRMLDFVRAAFLEDPLVRWPWMAHAVFVAKHRLRDLPFALELARELRLHAEGPLVPSWAQQMELFVLEQMGDREGAMILLGALIESGAIADPREQRFLLERLDVEQDDSAGRP